MGFLSSIGSLLQQCTGPEHFDQMAQAVPQSSIASGLAEAFRSGETPPFAQMAGQLFSG
jgi:hypothetical protein